MRNRLVDNIPTNEARVALDMLKPPLYPVLHSTEKGCTFLFGSFQSIVLAAARQYVMARVVIKLFSENNVVNIICTGNFTQIEYHPVVIIILRSEFPFYFTPFSIQILYLCTPLLATIRRNALRLTLYVSTCNVSLCLERKFVSLIHIKSSKKVIEHLCFISIAVNMVNYFHTI